MANDAALREQLTRWFQTGDQRAYRRAYEDLAKRLHSPREVIEALGNAAVDEIRQDVLARLLAQDDGALREASSPVGLALKAFHNDIKTVLRKWGPRAKPTSDVVDHVQQIAARPGAEAAETRLDVERAMKIAETLEGKGRLAVLLTTRPDRISDTDWMSLVASLPPPPPRRPAEAVDRDEASMLLYPPRGPETTTDRYQRLNSFDKTYKRAIAAIRVALGVES